MNKNTVAIVSAAACLLALQSTRAGSATWNSNPSGGDWSVATNWTPTTVRNGMADVASFGASNVTDISLPANRTINLDSIVFNAGASAYLISNHSAGLDVNGAGITNNSSNTQGFFVPADSGSYGMEFFGSATAGSNTDFTVEASTSSSGPGGVVNFWDSASAATASFTLFGPGSGGRNTGGRVFFHGNSTAGASSFQIEGGGDYEGGGPAFAAFYDYSGAGNATFVAEGGFNTNGPAGEVLFFGYSSAEDATILTYDTFQFGGEIYFNEHSTGGKARILLSGLSHLYIGVTNPSITIGSLEGGGDVSLFGSQNLIIGSNNLSTIYNGKIWDTPGSLTKIGHGTLTLTTSKAYSGGTIVNGHGSLLVNTQVYSGTGSGPVQVNRGTLGGNGVIGGPVTIGTGAGEGALLSPGGTKRDPGVLTIQSALTFNSDGALVWKLNSRNRALLK